MVAGLGWPSLGHLLWIARHPSYSSRALGIATAELITRTPIPTHKRSLTSSRLDEHALDDEVVGHRVLADRRKQSAVGPPYRARAPASKRDDHPSTMTTPRPPDPIAQRPNTTNTIVHRRIEARGLVIPSPDAAASFLVELLSLDCREVAIQAAATPCGGMPGDNGCISPVSQ